MHYRFKIYPSLMDAYDRYLMSEDENAKDELIAKINRVPPPQTMAAALGTAFNNLVDAMIAGSEDFADYKDYPPMRAASGEFEFLFDGGTVARSAMKRRNASCQVFCAHHLNTSCGEVELYGYADFVEVDEVADLKTTANYTTGKYLPNWQRHVYPVCLVGGGYLQECKRFTFDVVEVLENKNGIIIGRHYDEPYVVDVAESERKIKSSLECGLLPFLIDNQHIITDKKIISML